MRRLVHLSAWTAPKDAAAQTERALGLLFAMLRTAQLVQSLVVINIPLSYCRGHLIVGLVTAMLCTETLFVLGSVVRHAKYGGRGMAYIELVTAIVAIVAIALDAKDGASADAVNWMFAPAIAMVCGMSLGFSAVRLALSAVLVGVLYAGFSIGSGANRFPVIFNFGGISAFPVMSLICYLGVDYTRRLGVRLADSERREVAAASRAAKYEERERHGSFLHDSVIQVLEEVSARLSQPSWRQFAVGDIVDGAALASRQCRLYLEGRDPLAVETVDVFISGLEEHARSLQLHMTLVDEFVRDGATIDVDHLTLLNIAGREALRNARKHGHTHRVTVRICNDLGGGLALVVSQPGTGFDRVAIGGDDGSANPHFSALRRIGGSVSIDTEPEESYGVRVRLCIPMGRPT